MPGVVTALGRQRIGVQVTRGVAGSGPTYNVNRHAQTMGWDDSPNVLADGHTSADDAAGITNFYDRAFDALPVTVGDLTTMIVTIPTGSGNFPIHRSHVHDDTAANVSASSDTLMSGVDSFTSEKNSDLTTQWHHSWSFADGG